MGSIRDLANSVYADGPVSAPNEPIKALIRSLFEAIDTLVLALQTSDSLTAAQISAINASLTSVQASLTQLSGALGGSGTSFYATKAAINADLVPGNGFLAQVYNDPDFVANEFFWMKSGATGTGSWTQTAIPTQRYVDRLVSEILAAPSLRNSLLSGNIDKYDAMQIVDAASKLVFGASQKDGEIRVGAHVHKPVVVGGDAYQPAGFPCSISAGDIVVTHENGSQTIDGAPYTFSVCGPGTRFICAAWDKPAMGANTPVQIDRNAELFVPYGSALAIGVVADGQSLAAGSQGIAPIWTNPHPDYILMPDTGSASDVRLGLTVSSGVADVLSSGEITGLRAMESRSGVESATYGQTPVETLCSAMHGEVLQKLGFAPRLIGMSLGIGGFGIVDLKKGTQHYTNTQVAIADVKAEALADGWRYWLPAIYWRHGEADAASTTYAADMIAYRTDFNTDSKAITGQASDIWFILAQPSSFANVSLGNSVKAMLDLHVTQPNAFVLSHPSYMLDYDILFTGDGSDDDNVHLSPIGYALDGEYAYKAWRKTIFGKTRWEPLRPLIAVRSGNVIDITFAVPVQPLVLDTTTVTERAGTVKGFEYTDDGTPPAISSVTVTGPDTVRITLAATPTGANKKIRYAMKGYDATSPRPASERPRGNLRDSDTTQARFDPSRILYNWCVHFEMSVV
ncbi:hypothetical protein GOA58_05850 [Sinorhizobium meliloti]|uniref:hypothetical protein n=1 Tax=Rhizobium meliloti TaxID=382 RepID=UPI00299DF52C|nr:hypothetical protein [Sinorhizobium meliloti]MDW9660099.1 hypothetical protein [Sinorhizobium meliloti]MDX0049668.1 hypothetical protein [Sinorhizobium meliloti]